MTITKLLGLLLVVVCIVVLQILAFLDIQSVFEPRLLLPLLNTLFAGIIPIVVGYVAGKTYLKTDSATILFMGCGMLSFGLCAVVAGWMIRASDGPNLNVTVYNTGALIGSLFHSIGAIISLAGNATLQSPGKGRLTLATAYLGVAMFVACFSLAALQGLIPPFFVQGVGPTGLRQLILGNAIFLYVFSSMFLMGHYVQWKSDFLYWYSLSLAMLAIGLFAFFVQKTVGCPIGWFGRSANYLGGLLALIAIFSALRDARTKRMSLESAIAGLFADAEASYKTLVETASDAIITLENEGRIIGWNTAAERMFGYTKEEAIGLPFFEKLIREEFVAVLKSEIHSSILSGTKPFYGYTFETEANRKDGSFLPVELSLSTRKVSFGWVSTWILRDISPRKQAEAVIQALNQTLEMRVAQRTAELDKANQRLKEDVEGRKCAEKALQEANSYNRSLIEASLDPLVTISAVGKITDVNAATERVTGYSRDELIGTDFADYFTDPDKARAGYQQVFKDGSVKDYELEIRHKSGELTPVMYNASLFRDECGEITGVFAAAREISDLKQAEEKLATHARNLELANAEMEQFTYVASHDLQEPLRKMISFSELLREDLGENLPQVAAADLGFIADAAARMQALVRDLLALSRIGRAAVKREKIPLQECTDAAISNLSKKIEETGAEIVRDSLPMVVGDRTLLTQLYQNLIGNSLHYRANNKPRIHLTCEKTEDGWVLGVLDNGIGIKPEYLDQIFLPFKRLHTRQEYEGTGIGLSICRKVVNLCGGLIWAESEGENKGAHFKFTLKRWEENQK